MKRRLFLKGLLGASAVVPIVAKAIVKDDPFSDKLDGWVDVADKHIDIAPLGTKGNTLLTPEQLTNEAFKILSKNLREASNE